MQNTLRDQNEIREHAEWSRRCWRRLFGHGVRDARKARRRSIDDTARLAGMELSEWMALEDGGWLPQTPEQLRAIAGALEMNYDRMCRFALLCWSAWEQ